MRCQTVKKKEAKRITITWRIVWTRCITCNNGLFCSSTRAAVVVPVAYINVAVCPKSVRTLPVFCVAMACAAL